jgi:hypothetical protein
LYLKQQHTGMSRLIATIFFSIYLLSTSELDQLMKIPVVFQHYHEHIRMEGNISFTAFLAEHYLHSDPKDPDYARDMQLPFKTQGHSFFFLLTPATAPRSTLTELQVFSALASTRFANTCDYFIPTGFHKGIFQPPRQA